MLNFEVESGEPFFFVGKVERKLVADSTDEISYETI